VCPHTLGGNRILTGGKTGKKPAATPLKVPGRLVGSNEEGETDTKVSLTGLESIGRKKVSRKKKL